MKRSLYSACLIVALAAIAAPTFAANEIGAVSAAEGNVEVRRASAGNWKALDPGAPVFQGDELRTGERGRVKIFFQDESVLDLGATTSLAVKEYATKSAKRAAKTVIALEGGHVRVLVGEAYADRKASYEVETPTAVVRADGTMFLVGYDADSKTTEVIGVEGTVEVQGAIGLIGPSIKVAEGQRTEVQEGKFPLPVSGVEAETMTAAIDAVEIIGTGGRDGLAADNPILRGDIVRTDEKPSAQPVGATAAAGVSYLEPIVPGETLRDRLSPAARANTQPILEYKVKAPDEYK